MKEPTRLELHEILCSLLGSRNVYFQAPATMKIQYPCIQYEPLELTAWHADNSPYAIHSGYRLIYIDQNRDSAIPKKIAGLQGARAARPYVSDNLYHWPFDLRPVITTK